MQTSRSFFRPLIVSSIFLLTLLGSSAGWADGGGGPSSGPGGGCRLQLDTHLVSFTAYQPQLTGNSPYCTEIPETGNISVVFDLEDKALRDIPVEFEITREKDGSRIMHQPPGKILNGVFNRTLNITEMGDYIAKVSLVENDKKHEAHLKFHVAEEHGIPLNTALVIGIVLMVAGYFLYQSNPAFQASVKKLMGKLS
jgi:hypothetical protein